MSSATGKRKSRFESTDDFPVAKRAASINDSTEAPAAAAAAARAAEISRELSSKIALVSSIINTSNLPAPAGSSSIGVSGTASVMPNLGGMRSVLPGGFGDQRGRKAAYMPLILDDQGREVDQFGNVVKRDTQVKTLVANKAVEKSKQKKNNPYLAHRKNAPSSDGDVVEEQEEGPLAAAVIDIRVKTARREVRGRKSLHFVEAGKFVKEADELKAKEERKLIAGYASGRKALQQGSDELESNDDTDLATTDLKVEPSNSGKSTKFTVPPAGDSHTNVNQLPSIEWWDEPFLPKIQREELRSSKQRSSGFTTNTFYTQMTLHNARTFKLVQHPASCKALSAAADQKRQQIVLPTYLTKKERKKLRRATRQERELEKRDKMMMGLISAPEPKFKLSNFMKVLGDQAIADPSKVEMKVLEQMQQRVMNHEMRNQAAKLTPAERKEKKTKKLQELEYITMHGVLVAVFRVRNFSNLRHRFKVDVNAQQHFLSGIVLLCGTEGLNLIVVEGGPKGIQKFIRLMTERIRWNDAESSDKVDDDLEESDDDDEESDGNSDSRINSAANKDRSEYSPKQANSVYEQRNRSADGFVQENCCDLLWRGNLPKRSFTGFKFQESKNSTAARKMLKARGVEHYWDMVESADSILASSEISAIF